ncbi:hypothetical protein CB1_001437030 [Camelus ferus]|nr:hypothetical protein CB1_001437030 [Camelus ferus]
MHGSPRVLGRLVHACILMHRLHPLPCLFPRCILTFCQEASWHPARSRPARPPCNTGLCPNAELIGLQRERLQKSLAQRVPAPLGCLSPAHISPAIAVVITAVYSVVFVVGLVGNSLVMFVIIRAGGWSQWSTGTVRSSSSCKYDKNSVGSPLPSSRCIPVKGPLLLLEPKPCSCV